MVNAMTKSSKPPRPGLVFDEKKRRWIRPRKPPQFDCGDTVFGRTIRVRTKGGARKYLVILRGAKWRVTDIHEAEPPSRARPRYTLYLDGFTVTLPESQLRKAT